ncbi:hypothetical protein D6833_05650 [Candidatus Parcubacteria bacterium]|nr:MAG: hypothetical protein D6833_05650 [Candidatus Parcubacteria bacterium]
MSDLSISLNVNENYKSIATTVRDILYHPALVDDVRFVDDLDLDFVRDTQYEIPRSTVERLISAQCGDILRYQLHHVEFGYFADLVLVELASRKSVVLLLQVDPLDHWTAQIFDTVRQAVIIVLADRGKVDSKTLERWREAAIELWGKDSEVWERLTRARPRRGRPPGKTDFSTREELVSAVNQCIDELTAAGERVTKEAVAVMLYPEDDQEQNLYWFDRPKRKKSGGSVRKLHRALKNFGLDWKYFRRS